MSQMTAKQLIAHLQEHYGDRPDEVLVYTFWDSTDIEIMLDDENESVEAKEVWEAIAEDADVVLERFISDIGEGIQELVCEFVRGESDD